MCVGYNGVIPKFVKFLIMASDDLCQVPYLSGVKTWQEKLIYMLCCLFTALTRIQNEFFNCLRGYCTSYQKLACFVLYLKIINNFLKNRLCILYEIVEGPQKWR